MNLITNEAIARTCQVTGLPHVLVFSTEEIEIKNFNDINVIVKVAGFSHLKEMKNFDFDF